MLNERTNLNSEQRSTFRDGKAEKELFPKGTRFYRLVSRDEWPERGNNLYSDCYLPEKEFKETVAEAKATNSGIGDVSRRRQAIQREWNYDMNNLAVIELKQDVYGWRGTTGQQAGSGPDDPSNPNRRFDRMAAGGEQVVIPGLNEKHAQVSYTMDVNERYELPTNREHQMTDSKIQSKLRYDDSKEQFAAPGSPTPMDQREELRAKMRGKLSGPKSPDAIEEIREAKQNDVNKERRGR